MKKNEDVGSSFDYQFGSLHETITQPGARKMQSARRRVDQMEQTLGAVHRIAETCSYNAGLRGDDLQDCVIEFVTRVWQQTLTTASAPVGCKTQTYPSGSPAIVAATLILRVDLPPDQSAAWLRCCAANFALNFRRKLAGRRQHEVSWSDTASSKCDASEECHAFYATHSPSCETVLLHREWLEALHTAVEKLPPIPRELFARFHLDEDELIEVVLSSGKSHSAVKQSLLRSRQQVRLTLLRQGRSEDDLRLF